MPSFAAWRTSMGLTQQEAAEALGLHLRTVQRYEEKPFSVPVTVLLACRCLWLEKRIGDLLYEDSLPDRAVKALKERLSKPGVIAPSERAKASPQELPE